MLLLRSADFFKTIFSSSKIIFRNTICMSNGLDPDQGGVQWLTGFIQASSCKIQGLFKDFNSTSEMLASII